SAVLETTALWPIAVTGSLPVCSTSRVMVGQLAETVASFRSNFIASSPLSETVQLPAAWAMPAAPIRARAARMRVRFFMVLLRGDEVDRGSVRGQGGADLLQECGIGSDAGDLRTCDLAAFRVQQYQHAGVVDAAVLAEAVADAQHAGQRTHGVALRAKVAPLRGRAVVGGDRGQCLRGIARGIEGDDGHSQARAVGTQLLLQRLGVLQDQRAHQVA